MPEKKFPIRRFDIVIILFSVCLTGFSAIAVYAIPGNSSRIYIQGSGREWIFPADAEETIAVPGPLGDTVIRISGQQAWVESSPCANQVCASAGKIRYPGVWTACLPNNVFLMMEGTDDSGNAVDGISW